MRHEVGACLFTFHCFGLCCVGVWCFVNTKITLAFTKELFEKIMFTSVLSSHSHKL